MSLASSLSITILNASRNDFFLLVFLSLSTEFDVVALALSLFAFFFFRMFSLTVANSPVGSVACASMSLKVLATEGRGTNSCHGPFLPKR